MTKILVESYNSERVHNKELKQLLSKAEFNIDVATAYLTDTNMIDTTNGVKVRLLTSVSSADLISGATSLEALRWLLTNKVNIRVLPSYPKFHAKVYIADKRKAIVSSANLTHNGVNNNIEVGVALEGETPQELCDWYETIWQQASPLTIDLLDSLSQNIREFESELSLVKQKMRSLDKRINSLIDILPSKLLELDNGSRKFFICNSDRRNGTRTADGGYLHEELMLSLGVAMAWENFSYPQHMSRASVGDVVFLFAKRKGIIAIGLVTEPVTTADGVSKKRLSSAADTREWRVSVDWITQRNKSFAYHLDNPPLWTFTDISDSKYAVLRNGVLNYFSEVGSS